MFCKATAHDGCSAASHCLRQTDDIACMTAIDECQNSNLMSFIMFRRFIDGGFRKYFGVCPAWLAVRQFAVIFRYHFFRFAILLEDAGDLIDIC